MSAFLYWITMTHTQRYHAHYQTTGNGHVCQGRFKEVTALDNELTEWDTSFDSMYLARDAARAATVDKDSLREVFFLK